MDDVKEYLRSSRGTLVGLVMVLPLLVFYNVGLLVTDWGAVNGADVVTWLLVTQLDRTGYLVAQGVLLLAFVIAILYLQRKRRFHFGYFLPLLVESTLYALAMGSVIIYVMREIHLLGGPLDGSPGLLMVLTISAGAGVHEELLFRLLLIGGTVAALTRWTSMSVGLATVIAVLGSAVLFSVAHYLGPEEFALYTFAYRSLAGLVFASLFLLRGLAVAVYTHALYDVYVLAFR
jgi:hypothetical protein